MPARSRPGLYLTLPYFPANSHVVGLWWVSTLLMDPNTSIFPYHAHQFLMTSRNIRVHRVWQVALAERAVFDLMAFPHNTRYGLHGNVRTID